MEFKVNLITVKSHQTNKALSSLKDNCTHIINSVWLMEGVQECLADDEVVYNFIETGIVPNLGGLTQEELLNVCDQAFLFDVRLLKYKREGE